MSSRCNSVESVESVHSTRDFFAMSCGRDMISWVFSRPVPKSQKDPPDEIVKDLKWYKTNVVVLGMTI